MEPIKIYVNKFVLLFLHKTIYKILDVNTNYIDRLID